MKKILTLAIALVAITSLVQSAEKAYVINHCPVTPVREEPSEAAEQATQLLFGDVCEVVETRSSRIKIRSLMDGQVGWITTKMTTAVSEEEAMKQLQDEAKGVVVTPMAVATVIETGEQLMLTIGTRLPNYANGRFEMLGKRYKIDAKCVRSLEAMRREATGEKVVRMAKTLLNVSYLWGGKNMMGYDCSGFTQTVYSVFGVNLLRNAREQVTQGQVVNSLAESRPGDLVFFDHADRDPNATRITHVGMLISPTEVIHCAGWVHIAKIDEKGIRLANGKYSHHLAHIKRYVE